MEKKDRIFATLDNDDKVVKCESLDDAVEKFREVSGIVAVVELDEQSNIMRYIVTNECFVDEVCPHCGCETLAKAEFRSQYCVECGKTILPCSMCYTDFCDCRNCPLEKSKYRKYLGGVKPTEKE